ncbi:hypothetical protein BCR35DRAFT_140361 [Leucosporidium creatinivorum]|uniref:NUDE domain-containing protein n=1 Tax=Leucosporidium creatinivorum TaxID=106004 RepID=A0A1Y2ET85_9BASI|nr:hypothetical protein BCR35DRAFT_140361 [Leucosporidium creatinivorum]
MEKGEREMRKGLEEARGECEDWKTKYTATLRDHTNTMTHMQRELESLRASEKDVRTKLRDMELDNDDLEKSEREKDSSLQDLENRYGKSIERIALLEEELVNKAQLEEEVQRLKDELRDLHEELAVIRTQSTTYPPAYPRPLTPPGTTTSDSHPLLSTTSSSPTPAESEDVFATPRKPTSPSSTILSSPPSISLVNPTPMRSPPAPRPDPPSPIPPLPPFPASSHASTSRSSALSSSTLARSTKTRNLSSAAPPATPKAIRESRVNGTIQDMKNMTDRVKQLTSRLDSRRNLVMAGSSIPRASMSPGSSGLARSSTSRRLATGTSSLGKSVGPTAARAELRSSSRAGSRTGSESESAMLVGSTRPSSRSAMRQSIGGGGRTSIPVRPPSRLSSLSTTSSSSRPVTPSLPSGRSPTPTSSRPSSSLSNRPPWGSTAANTQQSSLGVSTRGPPSLTTSTRRRASTALPDGINLAKSVRGSALGVSTNRHSTEIPLPRRSVSRNGTRPGEAEEMPPPPRVAGAGGSLGKSTMGVSAERRASFGLMKSVRRPSGTGP